MPWEGWPPRSSTHKRFDKMVRLKEPTPPLRTLRGVGLREEFLEERLLRAVARNGDRLVRIAEFHGHPRRFAHRRPVRQALAVRISRARKIGPIGRHHVGDLS